MSPMILGQIERQVPGSGLYVFGDLILTQKQLLPSSGEYTFDNENTQNSTSVNVEDIPFDRLVEHVPEEIMIKNLRNNFTTELLG